jgi:hypothetical protein
MSTTTDKRKALKIERAQRDARLQECLRLAREQVATGKCPQCGAGLRNNLAISGWWQCNQYGAEGFRKDSTKPACSWQAFTV